MKNPLAGKVIAVCLHPTIDLTYETARLDVEGVVRGRQTMAEPAGKGINVARTLAALGCPVLAAGFIGRNEIPLYENSFDKSRADTQFVPVAAPTRRNLTLIETATGRDLHILDAPMRVQHNELAHMQKLLRARITPNDWIVFSGSCPAGIRQADFAALLKLSAKHGQRVIVDTSGHMLRAAIKTRPWLIKPNLDELAQLTKTRPATRAEALASARQLLPHCETILLSLGADGAILVTADSAWHAREKRKIKTVHTVGCGDALLSGFLAAYAAGKPPPEALRRGVACGSACVRTVHAAITATRQITGLLPKVTVSPCR